MNLLNYGDDSDSDESLSSKVRIDPAPLSSHPPPTSSSTPSQSPSPSPFQSVTVTDAVWQRSHYAPKRKKKPHKRRRDYPWSEPISKPSEASITDRLSYKQRIAKRTWFPAIGDTELPDTVIWHNTVNIKDHLGRSWVLPPISFVPNPDHECFMPRSRVHRFSYHTASVTNVEMFPTYGHMILSSSLDTTLRVWSLSGDRQCLQTYIGHTQGVRDCTFTRDGLKFVSACYGRRLKLWDTEKGAIGGALLDSVPSQIVMDRRQDDPELLCGLQDGRVVQYDLRTAESSRRPIREYKSHAGPVFAVVFLSGWQFFVTAGEDSTLALWQLGNVEPIGILKEGWMRPITALVAHPRKPFVLAQMQGNEIAVFKAGNAFEVCKKRSFVGHNPEAFACRMTMSPDGSFVASGDATGSLFIWDWKSAALRKTFQLHDQVVVKADWNPLNPSQIITASWDNSLSLLD
jgi:pre-mRNA-processing factor 17